MSQVVDETPREAPADTDLAAAVLRVLADSPEPLTLSKIRSQLPGPLRRISLDQLAEVLRRQTAANVVQQYPKYRSQQDRFWDRPMPVHVAQLLQITLDEEGPLPWSLLRRKLPAYAVGQAEAVLQEQVGQGRLHRHPPLGSRAGERFGVRPPDPKDYLRQELPALFRKLEPLGFSEPQLREAAMALLQEEEWAPPADEPQSQAEPPRQPAPAPEMTSPVPPGPGAPPQS